MAELRWVLLALGVLVVAGIYLWSRGLFKPSGEGRTRGRLRVREEPHISLEADLLSKPSNLADEPDTFARVEPLEERDEDYSVAEAAADEPPAAPSSRKAPAKPANPDKVVTIRLVPKHHLMDGHLAVASLREAGLEHGRYDIFHKHKEGHGDDDDVLFSVASLTEPGTFDLDNLRAISGMSFFVVLPGGIDPVECFDSMVETARSLAHRLDADLLDERGSSWSIQRERYLREELIRYRHQHYVH